MKQVLKATHIGKTVAVYRNEKWGMYEYRICYLAGKKRIWVDECETFGEAAEEAIYLLHI